MTGFPFSPGALRLTSRAAACGPELASLVFVGGVTYLATQYIAVTWTPAPWEQPGTGLFVAGAAIVLAAARRRFPVLALLAAALLVGRYPAAGVTLAMTSYGVAARTRSARSRGTALAVAALIPFTIGLILIGSRLQWQLALGGFGLVAVLCVVGPTVVQALLAQRERLIDVLRQQTRFAASAARLQERSRIAQEMHDLLGHRLSLISLYAGSLELDAGRPVEATEPARLIRDTVQIAMDELRATLGILRQGEAGATEPIDHTGTRSDVRRLVRQAQAGGTEVDLTWHGDDLTESTLPVRQAVHRIVREGLTNLHRHAAGAQAHVVVDHGPARVRVQIVDDGRGGTGTTGSGLGLVGVAERVRLLGGTLTAGPLPSRGFRLAAEVPLAIPPPGAGRAEPGTGEEPDDRWGRLGQAVVLATGLAGAVAILVVVFSMLSYAPGMVDRFDSIGLGVTRGQVTDSVGPDDSLAHRAARGAEPPTLPGVDCSYTFTYTEDGATMIERYCFRSDVLVDKTRFPLPAA
ncbi:sensor histidine kinase [Amycolatopsis sp. MtRt-6]|uniref:sensor histidine kinase n=1 Tax=Amycolatopsis sp. MtRt-6 TaxID=2792782 RepID=UPI001A8FCB5B|nr:histidine kinase [Amycolatopsis sp. MtRt-6]